jgi:hypothetical protein
MAALQDSESSGSDWEEVEEDNFFISKCLFCSEVRPSPEDVLRHGQAEHGFNLARLKCEYGQWYTLQ